MGEIGDITPNKVSQGITEAALDYALIELQRTDARAWSKAEGATNLRLGLTCVMVGTNGINGLNAADSMAAIVSGVFAANRLLRQRDLFRQVRIEEVQFIELYEDLAIEAAHAARDLETQLGFCRSRG